MTKFPFAGYGECKSTGIISSLVPLTWGKRNRHVELLGAKGKKEAENELMCEEKPNANSIAEYYVQVGKSRETGQE